MARCQGNTQNDQEERLISPKKDTVTLSVHRWTEGMSGKGKDRIAVEEPMEVRLQLQGPQGSTVRSVAVTMRTPGRDFELAVGFLFSEGILTGRGELQEVSYCREAGVQDYNVVTVGLRDGVQVPEDLLTRNFYTSSSCGVCGKGSLEAVELKGCRPLSRGGLSLDPGLIPRLPDLLLEGQVAFQRTGGLHAAGLFDGAGNLLFLREDVGRHNAVDKVVGHALLEGTLPLEDRILVVSGRTSFEILQKAVAAGIPAVVAVGAPSSLAVELAREFGVTLVGFARDGRFNLYAGAARVEGGEDGEDG